MGVMAKVLPFLPLVLLLILAVGQDLHAHKIRNWLTLTILLSGLAFSFMPHQYCPTTVTESLLGIVIGFALPFVMFAIGAMGGGDVKLMAGVGAWLGPWPIVTVFILSAIIGAILGILTSLLQRRLVVVLRNTWVITLSLLNIRRLGVEHVREVGQACGGTKKGLPYAVPIFIGTLLTLLTPATKMLLGR